MKPNASNTTPTVYPSDSVRGDLRGSLADTGPSQILNLLHYAKKTGTLRFFQPKPKTRRFGGLLDSGMIPGDVCGAIVFQHGDVIRASSTPEETHLADILYKAHKLDAQQVHLIHNWGGDQTEKALALTLINGNYVTHADVVSSIAQHTIDCVFEIMTWSDAFFVFEEGMLPPPDQLTVPVNTRQMIKEGALRTGEIRRLEQELPNLDFALKLPDDAASQYRGVQLNVNEWRVVSYITPDLTVGQIAALCHLSESEIRKIVHSLLEAGLAERVDRPARRRTPPPLTVAHNNGNNWPH